MSKGRKRRLGLALLILLCGSAAAYFGTFARNGEGGFYSSRDESSDASADEASIGEAVQSTNDVRKKVDLNLAWSGLHKHDPIYDKEHVFTGENSAAEIKLANGASLSMKANSIVVLDVGSHESEIHLETGHFVGHLKKGQTLKLQHGQQTVEITGDSSHSKLSVQESASGLLTVTVLTGSSEISTGGQAQKIQQNQAAVFEQSKQEAKSLPMKVVTYPIQLLQPVGGGVVWSQEKRFTELAWVSVPHVQAYEVEISKSSEFTQDSILKKAHVTENHFTLELPEGDFYWHVRAIQQGLDSISPSSLFTVYSNRPAEPTAPINGQVFHLKKNTLFNAHLEWDWKAAVDRFEIQVSESADFRKAKSAFSLKPAVDVPLANAGLYHWRVRPLHATNPNPLWSESREFLLSEPEPDVVTEVLTAAPEQQPPALVQPVPEVGSGPRFFETRIYATTGDLVKFRWHPVPKAIEVHFKLTSPSGVLIRDRKFDRDDYNWQSGDEAGTYKVELVAIGPDQKESLVSRATLVLRAQPSVDLREPAEEKPVSIANESAPIQNLAPQNTAVVNPCELLAKGVLMIRPDAGPCNRLELGLGYQYTQFTVQDLVTGYHADLISKYDLVASARWQQIWSEKFSNDYGISVRELSLQPSSNAAKNLSNDSTPLVKIAAGFEGQLGPELRGRFEVGYGQDPFAVGLSSANVGIINVPLAHVTIGLRDVLLERGQTKMGLEGRFTYLSSGSQDDVSIGYGYAYQGSYFMEQGREPAKKVRLNLGLMQRRQNTSVTDQNETSIFGTLTWDFSIFEKESK